jgi:O-antigen/teichoic acid export membrane protein
VRVFDAGTGNDTVIGGLYNDTILGNEGNDLIYGDLDSGGELGGNDSIFGGSGSDTVYGGLGNDTLCGDADNDLIYGDQGYGGYGGGADYVDGGDGNDALYGGAGNDTLIGNAGTDLADYSGAAAAEEEEDQTDYGMSRRASRGMLWSSLTALTCRGLGFANTIVLTHLMGKPEYGRANAAYTLASSIYQFSSPGLIGELIRRRERFEEAATLGTSFCAVIVLMLSAAAIVFAGPITTAFNAAGTAGYLRLATIIGLSGTLLMMADVLLCRGLRFGTQSLLELCGTLSMLGAAISLAASGWGGLALIIGQVLREVVVRVGGTAVTGFGWLRRPRWDWPLLKQMLSYGIPLYIAGLLNHIATTWDNLFIGKVLGMEMLGAYAAAYALTYVPVYTISERITTVFYSVVVQFVDDRERRWKALLRSLSAVLIFMAPVVVLTMLDGPRVVTLLFSAKWQVTVAPLVTCLSLVGAGLPLQLMPDYYFGALGVTRAVIGIMAVKVVLLFSGLFLFGRTDIQAAAWTVSGSFVVSGLLAFSMLYWLDHIPPRSLVRVLVPGTVGGLLMGLSIYGLRRALPFSSNLLMLIIEVATGCAVYVAYQLLFHRERIMDILGAFLGRRRARGG